MVYSNVLITFSKRQVSIIYRAMEFIVNRRKTAECNSSSTTYTDIWTCINVSCLNSVDIIESIFVEYAMLDTHYNEYINFKPLQYLSASSLNPVILQDAFLGPALHFKIQYDTWKNSIKYRGPRCSD